MEYPSVAQVLDELKLVRKGSGLTYVSAQQLECTSRLRAVEATLKRSKRPSGDRFAVALEFIACVAKSPRLMMGKDWSRIACIALNIDAGSEKLLGEREKDYWSGEHPSEIKTYLKNRKNAFLQLAGQLVGLPHSPCEIDADRAQEDAIRLAVAEYLAVMENHYLAAAEAARTLREHLTEREVFSWLEHGVAAAPRIIRRYAPGKRPFRQTIQQILLRVIRTEYRRWQNELGLAGQVLPPGVMDRLIQQSGRLGRDFVNYSVLTLNDWLVESEPSGPDQPFDAELHAEIVESKMALLYRSLTLLLRIVEVIEWSGGLDWLQLPEDENSATKVLVLH